MKKLNKKGHIAMNMAGWTGLALFVGGLGSLETGRIGFVASLAMVAIGLVGIAFASKLNNIKYN